MEKFWLIQRGNINIPGGPQLFSKRLEKGQISHGVVELSYMGAAEFEWGAIPRAYARIMNSYKEYVMVDSQLPIPGKKKLSIFVKKDFADRVIAELQKLVVGDKYYPLKEYSELETLVMVADITKSWTILHTRFWWCIDKGSPLGDWMAFFEDDSPRILKALEYDYNSWWIKLSPKEREKQLKR